MLASPEASDTHPGLGSSLLRCTTCQGAFLAHTTTSASLPAVGQPSQTPRFPGLVTYAYNCGSPAGLNGGRANGTSSAFPSREGGVKRN